MSPDLEQGPLREAAILTRAVENVFRKLIRLLIGRMSLTKLQEMIRIIFVEEAEANLRAEKLGENVSLSRLGIVTGLDTRTLKKIRRTIAQSSELESQYFLHNFNSLLRVYDLWMNDERYFDHAANQPRTLQIDEQELKERIYKIYKDSGLRPPNYKEVISNTSELPEKQVRQVINLLLQEIQLIKVTESLYFDAKQIEDLAKRVTEFIKEHGEIDAPRFKELTGLTRKFSIPLLEYFGAIVRDRPVPAKMPLADTGRAIALLLSQRANRHPIRCNQRLIPCANDAFLQS